MTSEDGELGRRAVAAATAVARLREVRLAHFTCAGCGYGASRATAPDRCPMCGDTVWDDEPWRPFGGFLSDADGFSQGDGHA